MRARLLVIAAMSVTFAYAGPLSFWAFGTLVNGHIGDRALINAFCFFVVVGPSLAVHLTKNGIRPGMMNSMAVVAVLSAIPIFGLGSFFVNALLHDTNGWHPAPTEAIILPAVIFGAVILPAAVVALIGAGMSNRASASCS